MNLTVIRFCKIFKNKTLILCCFPFFYFSQRLQDDWHLKKNEQGISVYTRKAFNSDFKELKSVFYLRTSLSSAVALISDGENYPNWVYKCGKSINLKKISNTEFIHYQTVVVPWPADNRDFVVNIELKQDEITRIVTIKSICNANYIPLVTHYVRITELSACWTLTPLKDGTIQFTYQLLTNPGGCIPAWLANMAIVDGPFETMVHFKDWITKEKYQKAKVSFIKELDEY